MNRKAEIVARARAIAKTTDTLSPADVWALGRLLRVAEGDAETDEEAALAEEASALATTLLARGRAALEWPHGEALLSHLSDPRGAFEPAADEVDRLGAWSAVTLRAEPSSDAAARARDTGRELAVAVASTPFEAALVPLAEAVSRRIAAEGVVVDAEPVSLALTELLGEALTRALGGEPLFAPRARLDEADVAALASILARALGKVSFAVPAELFDVAIPAARRESALTLHEAAPRAPEQTVVVFGSVEVTVGATELRVVVPQGGPREAPALVCIERGQPGEPCSSRGGATSRETVFTLPARRRELDGFALVIGERFAFLRRA